LVRATQLVQSSDAQKNTGVADAVHSAIDAAKQATTMNPSNVDNWSNLALVYQTIAPFTAGADELAIQNYQEALKREPNNPAYSTEIGKIFILRADAYRTLLTSKDEKTRTDAQTNMQAQLEKAQAALTQAIQAKQDFAPAHYALGVLFERQGHLKDAITKLEQVLAVNNKDVGVGFQLAILYYRNGNYDKAQYVLEQIEQVDPTFANAPWYLASLYADGGRLDDAIAQLQKLQKMYPDNTDVQSRLADLQKQKDSKSKPTPQPMPEPITPSAPAPVTTPAPAAVPVK
jgi:tetratricopeptide (TPR) repeat protein